MRTVSVLLSCLLTLSTLGCSDQSFHCAYDRSADWTRSAAAPGNAEQLIALAARHESVQFPPLTDEFKEQWYESANHGRAVCRQRIHDCANFFSLEFEQVDSDWTMVSARMSGCGF